MKQFAFPSVAQRVADIQGGQGRAAFAGGDQPGYVPFRADGDKTVVFRDAADGRISAVMPGRKFSRDEIGADVVVDDGQGMPPIDQRVVFVAIDGHIFRQVPDRSAGLGGSVQLVQGAFDAGTDLLGDAGDVPGLHPLRQRQQEEDEGGPQQQARQQKFSAVLPPEYVARSHG